MGIAALGFWLNYVDEEREGATRIRINQLKKIFSFGKQLAETFGKVEREGGILGSRKSCNWCIGNIGNSHL